jgi:hypothetical protein
MRFGHWRGVILGLAFIGSMIAGQTASADLFHDYTIPREVLAYDIHTGGPYYAPAIPWGHYAKSGLGDHYGKVGLHGKLAGLFHGGKLCGNCGGKGCGSCGGLGFLGHGGNGGCGDPGCGLGLGHGKRIKNCGLCGGKGCGMCSSSVAGDPFHVLASNQSPAPAPVASPQSAGLCGDPGCKLGKGHKHGLGVAACDSCDSCGGSGCGKCGKGLFGHGGGCDSCGGAGCGKCGKGLFGGKGCGLCGGRGCGACMGKGGLLSHVKGSILGLGHHNKIKYFVGPGGPVPLTPGYTPYIVTTRSPRDFLAFPPYTPDGF